ncbi:D-alanine--D-alanine ligase [soil metagenome]|nr:D-alanine--D-alanine ligase [Rubrobacteraceae bacterium]
MARIAVLRGGHSMERDVSVVTGRRVQHALERLGHEVHPLDIEETTTGSLMEIAPDAAFVCLHGPGGEDGTVQALLETLGIPYTGSGPLSSIRCMDKDYAKRALRAAGIQTPPFRTFLRRAMNEMGASAALDTAADSLGYPLVVKPAREGSSFGLSRVEEPGELLDAVYEALGYDAKILLEAWVEGKEISVPILEPAAGEPKVLGLVEIRPREGAYNFEAKYTPGATDFAIPAEVPDETAKHLRETALAAYRTLGCSGYARVDTIVDENGVPQVLDVKTIPGFTETSTFPLAAERAGIPFEKLVETILEAALRTEAAAKL